MGFDRDRAQDLLDVSTDALGTPADVAQEEERARVLRRCLARLPEKQRQVVYMRFYVDDSLDGIAVALGCSVGTVKSRLFHALDRLTRMNDIKTLVK